jgi:hypothetical protein
MQSNLTVDDLEGNEKRGSTVEMRSARHATESVDEITKALYEKDIPWDESLLFRIVACCSKDTSVKMKNLYFKTKSWREDTVAEYETINVASTVDFITSKSVPIPMQICGILLQLIQTMVYAFAIASAGPDYGPVQWTPGIMFALLYAAFAVSSTLFKLNKTFFVHLEYVHIAKTVHCSAKMMLLMESINILIFLISAAITIPRQGSTIDIVLNCTALTNICDLDEAVFGSMIVKMDVDKRRDYIHTYIEDHFSGIFNVLYIVCVVLLAQYLVAGFVM